MILFFITSGLFLGWSLGANDAANVFGSAVGTRMVSFTRAAVIASLFVIIGAVFQGEGASHTLGRLGAVNALGGSFTVALAAAITVYWMTRLRIPVSTTQAIVGAIIGWNLFSGNPTDMTSLYKIVTTWVSGPILGATFAVLLYMLLKAVKRRTRIHMVKYESYIRSGLLIAGAFGSYSLGANNIANVMGVFVPSISLPDLNLGLITLNGGQQLFLLGGIAIAFGIVTYSERVMKTVGNNLLELNADAALIIVLAHSLVLFIFSSTSLSNFIASLGLPRIPMVPVSSSQVIVGAILGIGLYKGAGNINLKTLRGVVQGWVTTPVIALVISYISLFFVKNVFDIPVFYTRTDQPGNLSENMEALTGQAVQYSIEPGLIISIILVVVTLLFGILWYREKQKSNTPHY